MRVFIFVMSGLISAVSYGKTTANVKEGVILEGYDSVSYFKLPKPVKGNSEFKSEVAGVTYLFSSAANKSEFDKDPKKYSPAYEGWCATAVKKGQKYKINPLSYKITDGRLFLFYYESGFFGGDAKKDWIQDEFTSIKKADANWPKVREMDP